MLKLVLLRLPALIIAGSIWFISSQSTLPQMPKGPLSWDKFQHVLAFAVLGAAIALWFTGNFWKRRPAIAVLITAFAGSLYGVIDEFHQSFVPGRNTDIWDWTADTIGAVLGALAFWLWVNSKNKLTQPPLQ